jgi:hypothetical protein
MDSQERFENMFGLVEAHQYEWAIWQAAARTVQLSESQLGELYHTARNADSFRDFKKVADIILAANKEQQP